MHVNISAKPTSRVTCGYRSVTRDRFQSLPKLTARSFQTTRRVTRTRPGTVCQARPGGRKSTSIVAARRTRRLSEHRTHHTNIGIDTRPSVSVCAFHVSNNMHNAIAFRSGRTTRANYYTPMCAHANRTIKRLYVCTPYTVYRVKQRCRTCVRVHVYVGGVVLRIAYTCIVLRLDRVRCAR